MKKKDLVGRKMYGFKFKANPFVMYAPRMDEFIGEIGEIVHTRNYSVRVQFRTRDGELLQWSYPISLVGEHLIKPKTQEIIFNTV